MDEFQLVESQGMSLGWRPEHAGLVMKRMLTAAGNLAIQEGAVSSAAVNLGVIVQPVFAGALPSPWIKQRGI